MQTDWSQYGHTGWTHEMLAVTNDSYLALSSLSLQCSITYYLQISYTICHSVVIKDYKTDSS